jgi:hypothetical protein
MMASPRPRGQIGGSFASRRGHASQLSISDPSHHVTEAIGTLYGDEDDSGYDGGRPLSFIGGSSYQEQIIAAPPSPEQRRLPYRSATDQPPPSAPYNGEHGSLKRPQTTPVQTGLMQRAGSLENVPISPRSPTISLRDVQADSAGPQFPLTNIDNPTDIAQELSNLQALRRMSMDVGNIKDPDMPPMSLATMPVIAPSGDDDENDPSRLLWVPARVHPELAPTEFKSFLETRVRSIRRRSGDLANSADGESGRSGPGASLSSGSSLRRQKSTLSRQIDNSDVHGGLAYVDGAERLQRQRSRGGHMRSELSIDELVKDPTKAVQKLAQESQGQTDDQDERDDKPILPMAPGMGLRRSTRTTYRKGGSLRSGDRPFSKRVAHRHQGSESSEPPLPSIEAPPGHGLARVQSEPISENVVRPSASARRPKPMQESPEALAALNGFSQAQEEAPAERPPERFNVPVRTMSNPQYESTPHSLESSQEQPAPAEDMYGRPFTSGQSVQTNTQPEPMEPMIVDPPPKSSRRAIAQPNRSQPPPVQQYTSKSSAPSQPQTLNEQLSSNVSPLPGSGASRTDSLTFIPTLSHDDKKNEKKPKKDDDASSSTSKSSGSAWKWFKGSTEDKEKKKEESKRSKTKALVERAQDNVRLDVIQSSIDKTSSKGRESFAIDRDNVDSKLQEERKKDGHRKSDNKKEKDGNIFSSIFGGSKKKEEKEKSSKKSQHLRVPSEPIPMKPLEPDVDYHWTRFPLLEERAIYRMAHIKLANPRRSLQSQVLLSNFMYSYLAIVQAMHPHMNVPLSPQQKRLEEEARRKREEEEYLAQQQMQGDDDQALDQYDYDYHRAAVRYADSGSNGQVDYVDDAQIYEDEHGTDQHHHHQDEYGYGSDAYDQGVKDYYRYHDEGNHRHRDDRDDMW